MPHDDPTSPGPDEPAVLGVQLPARTPLYVVMNLLAARSAVLDHAAFDWYAFDGVAAPSPRAALATLDGDTFGWAVVRIRLHRPASGVQEAHEDAIEYADDWLTHYEFVADPAGMMILSAATLSEFSIDAVADANEPAVWKSPDRFVAGIEALAERVGRGQAERRREPSAPPGLGPAAAPPPMGPDGPVGGPAAAEDLAAIRYLESAQRFERRLAVYLLTRPDVTAQLRTIVRAIWDRADAWQRRRMGRAAGNQPGTVGAEYGVLERVVETGNLRELMAMYFVALADGLVYEMLGLPGQDPKPGVLRRAQGHRKLRDDPGSVRLPDPDRVVPPLSPAEWMTVDGGRLGWEVGAMRYHVPLRTPVQRAAQATGGLVVAAASGSAYFKATGAMLLRERWGVPVDFELLRLALIAVYVGVEHHSLHEVMLGVRYAAELYSLPLSPYVDDWRRYRFLGAVLTEQELRAHVAEGGLFPDEHAFGGPDPEPEVYQRFLRAGPAERAAVVLEQVARAEPAVLRVLASLAATRAALRYHSDVTVLEALAAIGDDDPIPAGARDSIVAERRTPAEKVAWIRALGARVGPAGQAGRIRAVGGWLAGCGPAVPPAR
ncbi:hypothetical protein ABT369_25770 [Dactylosporangium sp. NPDC000244]|uniref:hypothetical protein n=1 Tax=Dactylosporangium sp. NPDC000244 TaxID=3154365 RepID=UPI00331D78AD